MTIGTFGGRFATDAIADSVNVLGGSFKVFVDFDAGIGEFDIGVFEATVEIGLATSGESDLRDTNHFFGGAVSEDNIFADFVFADGDGFAVD